MARPIDADALMQAMHHRAFETDGDTMWQSGCWVRYRAIEQTVKEQPTVEAIPVEWIEEQKRKCVPHSITWLCLKALLVAWKENEHETD